MFAVGYVLTKIPPGALELLNPDTEPAARFCTVGAPEIGPVGVVR